MVLALLGTLFLGGKVPRNRFFGVTLPRMRLPRDRVCRKVFVRYRVSTKIREPLLSRDVVSRIPAPKKPMSRTIFSSNTFLGGSFVGRRNLGIGFV